ncbi:peptidylprolyl isomerase [Phenylobacterium sp.]|uniref:peptidylprolyl isomerase n=1 Tax=Phenylobacterium sp. TaxID=1871053 RepID=UPI002BC19BF2|nr:peptidylprolyl isomerase [Phenylobacterium sp.]HLZ75531.1 peptidylprolyl isomerase [Phenylobacterium sp.]
MTGPRAGLRRLLSEPLTHFVILGAILFACGQIYAARTNVFRIEITPAHVAQLSHKYALQFGGPPDPRTLDRLVRDDVHDEILFRQGMALKLDQDDEIVRRRIVQKEQFLLQNLSAPAEPTDAQLTAYYAAHRDLYAAPPRVTFSHIYFAVGPGGDAAAEARAKAVLAKLSTGTTRGPELGDAFPDLYDFSAFEPEQVERLFGHTQLSQAVYSAPVGRWSGPFRSAYGWHLIHVDARAAGGQAPLSEIADRVRSDYLQAASDRANAQAFDKIARRFTVVRQDVGTRP